MFKILFNLIGSFLKTQPLSEFPSILSEDKSLGSIRRTLNKTENVSPEADQ